jgi:hypothetical protein
MQTDVIQALYWFTQYDVGEAHTSDLTEDRGEAESPYQSQTLKDMANDQTSGQEVNLPFGQTSRDQTSAGQIPDDLTFSQKCGLQPDQKEVDPADAFFAYLNHNLCMCNSGCDSDLFKKILSRIFSMLVIIFGNPFDSSKPTITPITQGQENVNLGYFFLNSMRRKKLSAKELSRRLGELAEVKKKEPIYIYIFINRICVFGR